MRTHVHVDSCIQKFAQCSDKCNSLSSASTEITTFVPWLNLVRALATKPLLPQTGAYQYQPYLGKYRPHLPAWLEANTGNETGGGCEPHHHYHMHQEQGRLVTSIITQFPVQHPCRTLSLHASGRGRCPLEYGEYRFASSSSWTVMRDQSGLR
jgi:hypothetical protein